MTNRGGVLVLGMHRSGTSAVTAALVELRLDPGRGALMGAMSSNPTGHFEVERLTAFDDDLLRSMGGRWSGPPPDDPSAAAALGRGALGAEARTHLDAVFGESAAAGGWVWKDPRACLVVPFWAEVLGAMPPSVLVIRHPLAVARSLEARDGFALDYGLALWERHLRAVTRDLTGGPVVVVAYDDLMADPASIEALASDLSGLGVAVDGARTQAAAAVLERDHRHHRPSGSDGLTSAQLDLWDALVPLRGAHEALAEVDLPPESPTLQLAFDEHTRMGQWEEQAHAHEETIEHRDHEIEDLRREMAKRDSETQAYIDEITEVCSEWEAKLLDLYAQRPVRAWLAVRNRLPGRRGAAPSPE